MEILKEERGEGGRGGRGGRGGARGGGRGGGGRRDDYSGRDQVVILQYLEDRKRRAFAKEVKGTYVHFD